MSSIVIKCLCPTENTRHIQCCQQRAKNNPLAIVLEEPSHYQNCTTNQRADRVSFKFGRCWVTGVCVLNIVAKSEVHSDTSAPLHRGRLAVCLCVSMDIET